ncbi:hypothetical protein B0H17DRAFT_1029360 [Mycena rosella]|uniref:Transmembrane protein n=1 Tax=Mycena rosella TaxID=1033263 RepID=A0AAD7MBQ1_MYCRO|nr:hypothetical protein B0H17DRAFT_1029360 [Mycena rosella]
MAPSGTYTPLPLHPNRLVRKYRKATPTPTPLTHEQIEYLVAKANEKTQQKNELAVSEPWTTVPNPVPDTGIHHGVKYPTLASVPSVSPPHSTIIPSLPAPLPTTIPLLAIPASTELLITPATTASLAPTTPADNQNNPPTTHRLSTAAISLIAVAGACLLLVLVLIIKRCARPTRRPHPVPSRPILDDPFPEDGEFETKLVDSPVFGGKERLSERPDNSSLWNWTQYPTPATTTVAPSTSFGNSTAPWSRSGTQGKTSYAGRNERSQYHHTDASVAVQTPANSPYTAPMQQVHSAFTRAANRLSMASASMYPSSPSSNPNCGLVTSFTADGYPVMERVNPRVLQRSRSSTVGERNNRERPTTRYSYGFAYDGAEVMSPQMTVRSPTIPITPAIPGRTRIKSSYYAHPRTSAMPPSQPAKVNVHDTDPSVSTPLHHKSASGTERDTKGLASVLGFGSPATLYPSSPQPTLYPDDSLSVVEAKRPSKRVHKKPAPNNRASRVFGGDEHRLAVSPTLDATAALGSLMLMDFSGEKSAVHLDLTSTSSATLVPKKTASRSDDKPPRVPSPPPLPSLTQMGLEHANPEAYAEYRSPTYSIYGLYETDRKSRVGS